jgi:UDP-N-acetylmuramoylalanine--D-glutamate ligase
MLAADCLSKGVAKVYLIGHCAKMFEKAWNNIVPCEMCGTLEAAVEKARFESHEGDCVILSPGTASFDQFKSYGERGDRFAAFARISYSD